MDQRERLQCLQSLDLFAAFPEADLQRFAADLTELEAPAGTVLCREDEPGREMYILLDGRVQVSKQNRVIATLAPVEYMGEMAIIETKPRSATLTVSRDATLLVLAAEQFRTYLAGQPQALVTLMQTLSSRVREDTRMLAQEFEKANILVHDMRNMLSVFMLLSSLARNVQDPQAARQIAFMQQARDNLAVMMDEALANAKRRQFHAAREPGSIVALIQDVVSCELAVHPDMADKNILLDLDRHIPDFTFNHLEIRRVLLNLLLNAAQASAPGGILEVKAVDHGRQAVIVVRDYGVGIAADLQQKIFSAHYTTKETGSGLGLAACQQIIVQRHGGTIRCQSTPGAGTTFTVTLPYGMEEQGC